MSYAKSLLDDTPTGAHLSPSQADCERSAGKLRPQGMGRTCPVVWDGWLCWPPTLGGATIKQPCPDIYNFNTRQYAYRNCLTNGTWYGAGSVRHDSSGWSNYSLCVLTSSTGPGSLPDGYDAAGGRQHLFLEHPEVTATQTTTVTQLLKQTAALPLDDVIGSGMHGLSALCLLLALVTWASLRLTDRLVTRRYLMLIATIVASFLFHTIVLTSRLRAVSLSVADSHSPHLLPSPSPLSAHPAPSPALPPHSPLRSGRPVPSSPPPWERLFTSPLPRRVPRHVSQVRSSALHKRTTERRSFAFVGDKDRINSFAHQRIAEVNSPVSSQQDKHESGWLAFYQKKARAARAHNGNSLLFGDISRIGTNQDGTDGRASLHRKRRELNKDDAHNKGKMEEENGHKKKLEATGSNGGMSSNGGSWVTLCQVGRAFYLLTDLCVYAFLFSMCLYYTLVVLGKELTFNRLVVMFLFGVGVPVVFVVFTILLYTFLPTYSTFGFSCMVDVLGDEFHWAITAPKLICVVLSMCLMTVSTYGFWRLHVPALHASSETFYARQGVLKTLALLLACSLAELFYLVTQYQKMYGKITSPYVVQVSTSVFGLKGCVLAFLLCFVDSEVLHGTCCAPASNGSEPWLRTAPAHPPGRLATARDTAQEVGEDNSRDITGPSSPGAYNDKPKHHVLGSRGFGEKV